MSFRYKVVGEYVIVVKSRYMGYVNPGKQYVGMGRHGVVWFEIEHFWKKKNPKRVEHKMLVDD